MTSLKEKDCLVIPSLGLTRVLDEHGVRGLLWRALPQLSEHHVTWVSTSHRPKWPLFQMRNLLKFDPKSHCDRIILKARLCEAGGTVGNMGTPCFRSQPTFILEFLTPRILTPPPPLGTARLCGRSQPKRGLKWASRVHEFHAGLSLGHLLLMWHSLG